MPAPAQVHVHTFKIGAFSALALWDGGMELPNDNKVFDLGRTPEEVAAVLSAAGLPTDKLALAIQPLLVKTAGSRVAVRTRARTTLWTGIRAMLLASLAEAGIDPQSVTDIFISHCSRRSRGRPRERGREAEFPNAKIHLSKPEWKFMSGQEQFKRLIPVIKANVDAFKPGAETAFRRCEGGRDQGPHPGPLRAIASPPGRHSSICRRLDAPLCHFGAETGLDHSL